MNYQRIATCAAATATLVALLAAGAGAQSTGTGTNDTTNGPTGSPGGPANPNSVDQQFVTQAIQANDQEIDQAQAQLRNTTDPNIKMFAQRMINDHSMANSEIAAVAKNLNLKYPSSHIENVNGGGAPISTQETGTPPPAATHPNTTPALPAAQYMQQEVQDHQKTIALFENESKNGGSPQVRAIAGQLLPTLRAHLAMAQQYTNTGRITPVGTPAPNGMPPR